MKYMFLVFVITGWILLKLIEYYYLDWIFWLPFWGIIIVSLFVMIIVNIAKSNFNKNNKIGIIKLIVLIILLLFSFFSTHTRNIIGKIDWLIHSSIRENIVEKILNEEINLNIIYNNRYSYKLQYKIPYISHRGNEIVILKNDDKIIIIFYIFRELSIRSSEYFVYTNNIIVFNEFEELIKDDPLSNWKIKENWYKIGGIIDLEKYIISFPTAHNRIVYASPPEGGSGCEKPQSGDTLCAVLSPPRFGNPAKPAV